MKAESPLPSLTERPADLKKLMLYGVATGFLLELGLRHAHVEITDSFQYGLSLSISYIALLRTMTEVNSFMTGKKINIVSERAIRQYDGRNLVCTTAILTFASQYGLDHGALTGIGFMMSAHFERLIQKELAQNYLAKQGMINS